MFVNHHYQAVFMHTPKTGGSSLLNTLDNGSTIWPHYAGFNNDTPEKRRWKFPHGQHARFTEVKMRDEALYNKIEKYYKFSIVRNPWAHAVSRYFYDTCINNIDHTRTLGGRLPLNKTLRKFELYLRDVYQHQEMSLLHDPNRYDDVEFYKLENLNEEIGSLMSRIGYTDFKGTLPHDRTSQKTYMQAWGLQYPEHYTQFYTKPEQVELVAERSKDIITKFNYTYR